MTCRLLQRQPHRFHRTQTMKCLCLPLHALLVGRPSHHQHQLMQAQGARLVIKKASISKHQMQIQSGTPADDNASLVICTQVHPSPGRQTCNATDYLQKADSLYNFALCPTSSDLFLLTIMPCPKRWHNAGRSRSGGLVCSMHTWHQTTFL